MPPQSAKRRAHSSRGETCCKPHFMTTKFTPQITITTSAKIQSAPLKPLLLLCMFLTSSACCTCAGSYQYF